MTELAQALIQKCKAERTTLLDLSNCGLTEIPPQVFELKWLENLAFSKEWLVNIKPSSDSVSRTKNVGPSNCIDKIPVGIAKLQNLRSLTICNTQVVDISPIASLINLRHLSIDHNQIMDISPLGKLTNLNTAWLDGNPFKDISSLKSLHNLKALTLNSSKVEDFSVIYNMINLRSLWLSENEIKNFQPFTQLKNLKALSVSSNNITDIIGIEKLCNLEELWISENPIKDISLLKRNVKLKYLSLEKIEINNDLASLAYLQNLERLWLYRNNIEDILILKKIKKLRNLGLSYNKIENISPLRDLVNLKFLWLDNNKIVDIGPIVSIVQSKKLEVFTIHGNPLKSPPSELAVRSQKAILAYFKHPIRTRLNEAKILLLGEGEAGKTSLVKALCGEPFDPKESQTHGIRIRKEQVEMPDGDQVRLHFWDFGGQEVMHATHQFFLSKRSVYLVVLNSRKEDRAEYWLKHAESFGGDSPVIVVLNKMDENPAFDVNRQFLREKYPNIKGFYPVSCKTGEGIAALMMALYQEIDGLGLRQILFPDAWLAAKTALENLGEDYISYEQFNKICKKHKVADADNQQVLLDFLNDLGVLLHFEQLRLHDTQVLNPIWLTNGVYRVINSPIIATQHGVFHPVQLPAIVNDARYAAAGDAYCFPDNKLLYIVEMMKQFELCYAVGDDTVIVPDLLPVEQNAFDFSGHDRLLRFVVEYPDILPNSFTGRLMVRLHRYIRDEQRWRTGMVLQDTIFTQTVSNVIFDREARRVEITIGGERRRDFLTFIRKTLDDLRDTFQKLERVEYVPLPDRDAQGKEVLVDYLELVGYEEGKQETYYSGKLKKGYPLTDLLNGIEAPEQRREEKLHNAVSVFVSYSEQDLKYREELEKALRPLLRNNDIQVWHDGRIEAGQERMEEIMGNLEAADLVLCLISADYIDSEFCYSNELKAALDAAEKGQKTVVPILIRSCHWKPLPISAIQSLPSRWMEGPNEDEMWTEVAKGIEMLLPNVKNRKKLKLRGIQN